MEKSGPHHVDASPYDIMYILKAAMEKSGVTGDSAKLAAERKAIRDSLKTLVYDGVTGTVCFDKNGVAELLSYVVENNVGKISVVDSQPAKKCDG